MKNSEVRHGAEATLLLLIVDTARLTVQPRAGPEEAAADSKFRIATPYAENPGFLRGRKP